MLTSHTLYILNNPPPTHLRRFYCWGHQVWPLNQFFSVSFLWKLIDLPGGQTLIRETLFSSIPPSNSLVSVLDPQRAFWADMAPFSGPRLASCVASGTTEEQGHRQVCRARREGPRTPSTTTHANLDCAFVENELFYIDPWLWEVNIIE